MTTNQILSELPQLIIQFSNLITNKTIVCPFKISYAIANNAKEARKVEVDFLEYRNKLQRDYCKLKDGKVETAPSVVPQGQPERLEIIFKSDEDKAAYTDEINAYLSKEITFKACKIDIKELESIDNIPPTIIDTLSKYGII